MKKTIYFPLLISVLFVLSSCSSMRYSTGLNLPASPLEKGDQQYNFGVEVMPETLPEEAKRTQSIGGSFNMTFGLGKASLAGARFWVAGENIGYSLGAHIALNIDEKNRFFISPRIGGVYDVFSLEHAAGLNVSYQFNLTPNSSFYLGGGYLHSVSNFGYATVGNVGFSANLTDLVYFNIEVNPIYQFDYQNNVAYLVANPLISFGFNIPHKLKRNQTEKEEIQHKFPN